MTHRERVLRAARREKPDMIPVAPYMGNYGASLAGVPIGKYCTDAEIMAAAQIKAWQILGQDVVVAQSDNYYIAEGFGCQTKQPANSTPNLVVPAAKTVTDALSLKLPNPLTDGRMPVYIGAARLLKAHFGDQVAIRSPGTGPFSLASYLGGGTENFLMDIATAEAEEDDLLTRDILDLMELSSDALIAFLKAMVDAGADIVTVGDSLASLSMISPTIYEKYVFPFECKVFSAINPIIHARGGVSLLHICGQTKAILRLMSETGADILEVDSQVDIGAARQLYGDKVAFMGNIEPTAILLQGSPEEVTAACEACLLAADAANGGFILGSGCEVPPDAPLENMRAMVAAVRQGK